MDGQVVVQVRCKRAQRAQCTLYVILLYYVIKKTESAAAAAVAAVVVAAAAVIGHVRLKTIL